MAAEREQDMAQWAKERSEVQEVMAENEKARRDKETLAHKYKEKANNYKKKLRVAM